MNVIGQYCLRDWTALRENTRQCSAASGASFEGRPFHFSRSPTQPSVVADPLRHRLDQVGGEGPVWRVVRRQERLGIRSDLFE